MEAFPLHQFLRTNFDSESHMERVEQILEAPTSLRTEVDCNFLVDCLSSIDFFKKTSRALCFEIARVAWFLSLEKNETVFKQGELGTKFYVILKGSVSVRVQDMLKPDDKGYEAAVLIAGKSFGELALHSDNSVRSATIVAIEDCGFLTVDRVDYDRILKKALDGEAQEKFEFCSDLPFLSDCSTRELQRLSAIMTKKKFDRDTMIFAQGDDSNNLYFVLSGEVRIVHYLEIKYATAEQIEAQRTARLNRLTHSLHAATSDELGIGRSSSTDPTNEDNYRRKQSAMVLPVDKIKTETPDASYFNKVSARNTTTAASKRNSVINVPKLPLSKQSSVPGKASARGAQPSTARTSSLVRTSSTTLSPRPATERVASTSSPDAIPRTFGGTNGTTTRRESVISSIGPPSARRIASTTTLEADPDRLARAQRALESFQERTAPKRPTFELIDLGTLGPRSFFGEIGLMEGIPRTASVFAKTRVELLVLSKGDFMTRMPEQAVEYLRNFRKLYPNYEQIMSTLHQQQKWESFRTDVIKDSLKR